MSSDDGHLGLVKVLALKEAARTGGEPVAHTAQWAVYPIESSARSALTVLGDPTWTCGAWPTTFLPLMSQCLTVTVRCAVHREQVADTQHCTGSAQGQRHLPQDTGRRMSLMRPAPCPTDPCGTSAQAVPWGALGGNARDWRWPATWASCL